MGTPSQSGAQVFEDGASYVRGLAYQAQAEFTRPNDTTAYTALDVVGPTAAVLTFADIGPSNGHILITDADLRLDLAAVPSGMAAFRLHLYSATPGSALADNAAFDLPSGDRATYLGYIDLPVPVDLGATLFSQPAPQVPKKVKMGASTSLYGYLQTIGGYTPTAQAVKAVRLNAVAV